MSLSDTPLFIPLPGRAHVQLTGVDRASFLHNFCTNDIKSLQPGQGCEAFVCNVKGRVLGHIHVFAQTDALWIDSVPGAATALISHLDRYLIREDVQFHDRTAEITDVLLTGPQIVESLTVTGLVASPHIPAVTWLREPSFVLFTPVAETESIARTMQEYGLQRGSQEDWESLRVTAGFPQYGVDITDEHLAQEVGRTTQAISFTKGCYLGQEPIARIDALGHVNRELRRFTIAGDELPARGSPLLETGGNEVGQLTSIASAPDGHGGVALGYLRVKAAGPGARFRAGNIDVELANANV